MDVSPADRTLARGPAVCPVIGADPLVHTPTQSFLCSPLIRGITVTR